MKKHQDILRLLGWSLLLSYLWFACACLSFHATSAAFYLVLLCLLTLVIFLCCVFVFVQQILPGFWMNLLLVLLSLTLFCLYGFFFVKPGIFSFFSF